MSMGQRENLDTGYEYIGHCDTEGCEKKGEEIKFSVRGDKVEDWKNEPPTCTCCGKALQGNVYETEK